MTSTTDKYTKKYSRGVNVNIPSQKKSSYGGRHLGFILTLLEVFIGCLIQNIFSANQIHKTTSCGFMDFIGSPREVTQVKLNAARYAWLHKFSNFVHFTQSFTKCVDAYMQKRMCVHILTKI